MFSRDVAFAPPRLSSPCIALVLAVASTLGCGGDDTEATADTESRTTGAVEGTTQGGSSLTAAPVTSTTGGSSDGSSDSGTSDPAEASTGAPSSSSGGRMTTTDSTGGSSGEMTSSTGAADVCGAVDILFVIDNSASMGPFQSRLAAAVPGFLDLLTETLGDSDIHLGVVTTDVYASNPAQCQELGGLVVQTGGDQSSDMACGPYAGGGNFMTDADDLAVAFDCAARVGTTGLGFELPMAATEAALGSDLAVAGACNEGFLREDAMLLLVVITDEYDGPGDPEDETSPGTPQSWYESVVEAKGGDASQAAAVVFTNFAGGPCPPEVPFFDGANLVEFTGLFGDNGLAVGICEPDYTQHLAETAILVSDACSGRGGP